MIHNFCNNVLENGGEIIPLIISSEDTGGTGLCNPSIFLDKDELILNLRHVNYTLYHSEGGQVYNNRYGPLAYVNPENDIHLKTINFFCKLDTDLSIKESFKIDTTKCDIPPVWEFHGLEDARLFRWEDKLYICGCRRDVKPDGESRMELSEIELKEGKVVEINRFRIEPPKFSYCEKNWMPVLDMPYHFIKWTNPTEVVQVGLESKTSKTVFLSNKVIEGIADLRGASQILSWGDYRICVVHDVFLFKNTLAQKNAKYTHRFVVWDKDWNIVRISDSFSFMDGEIEFCCGMTYVNNEFLITFGFQDNAAYLIRIPEKVVVDILFEPVFKKELSIESKASGLSGSRIVSYYKSSDRRELLLTQAEKIGIVNLKSIITDAEMDERNIVNSRILNKVSVKSMNCLISHLNAIQDWYDTSTEDVGIFFEDDVSFETIKYWGFTWEDFLDNLPKDFDCIQMLSITDQKREVKLRRRRAV